MDMQNYLRRFDTLDDYYDFEDGADFTTPNVSIIISEERVFFNPGWGNGGGGSPIVAK